MLKANGRYKAKIENYTIARTKKGDPMVQIVFNVEDHEGANHSVWWTGTLAHEKALPITLDALCICGYVGTSIKDFEKIRDGVTSGALDCERELLVTIDIENDLEGKPRNRVKWINLPGAQKFKNIMEASDLRVSLAGLNIEGALAAIRSEKGYVAEYKMAPVVAAPTQQDLDDIPF